MPTVTDGLGEPPALTTELIDAAHRRLLREDWELALCLTDLPLRIGRRPVEGHASPTHRVAVISLPALGAARLRRRALDTAEELVRAVLGQQGARLQRRLVDLAELADERPEDGPAGLAALARGGILGAERRRRPRSDPLFNAATTLTVLIGVLSLYVALMLLTLVGAALVITPDAFSEAVGTNVRLADYLGLAWFVSSLGTIGGALDAGLESDEAVREPAYAYRGEG